MANVRTHFQFQLRHLLWLVFAVACLSTYISYLRSDLRATREAIRIAQIHGGSIDIDYGPDTYFFRLRNAIYGGQVPQGITVQFQRMKSGAVSWGSYGPRGETVQLENWDAESIRRLRPALAQLHAMTGLSFWDSELPPGVLTEILPRSSKLTWLQLSGTRIDGGELAALSRVPNLERLMLSTTNVRDDDLRHVARLTKLVALRLDDTRVTDAGLKRLAHLRDMEIVDIGLTKTTPEVLPIVIAWRPSQELLIPAEWPAESEIELKAALPKTCDVRRTSYEFRHRPTAIALRPEQASSPPALSK